MKIKDSTLTIMVKDMDKSIAFYLSIGLALDQRWGNHYAQVKAPGLVLGIHPEGEGQPVSGSGSASIGFTLENFEEAKNELKQLSIPAMEREEEAGSFLHFKDPDGTEIYFYKMKR